jgi:hypothetical protein
VLEFSQMKNHFRLILLLILVGSLGCSQHRAKPSTLGEVVSPLKEARVFKSEAFSKGGNLLVVPFSAGAGVVANDELDRISLLIVKGIADVLGSGNQRFQLMTSQDSQDADVVIKGRIIQVQEKTTLSKPWGKKPKHLILSVEGSVLGVENEELVAKFAQIKEVQGKGVSLENLAYETGVEIGHFLTTDAIK